MRISERISTAVAGGVQCPGCGMTVKPTLPVMESDATEGEGGKRWSFVWRDPSGEVCPECQFPLARYVRRLKWIRTFSAGVVLLTIVFLLYALGRMTEFPSWYDWVVRVGAGVGIVVFLVGLVGLVVGGRSEVSEQQPGEIG